MPSVLIFDDDPEVGSLVADVVRSRGLTVEHHLSASGIVDIVREAKPRIVVLDVMMPGLDGLSACHAIRSNPATRGVRIMMLTSKTSTVDKEAAKRYGADFYLTKPFSIDSLSKTLALLLGEGAAATLPPSSAPTRMALSVLPGGAVLEADSRWLVLDAGVGVGGWLAAQPQPPREAWVFLSRYTHDAVAEIEATGILLSMGSAVRLAGPDSPETPLNHMAPRMARGARMARTLPLLHPLREGEIMLFPGVFATCIHALHPGLTMAYRFDFPGRRVVYCPAHIPNPDPATVDGHDARKFRGFFANADLMLHGFRRSITEPGEGAAWETIQDHASYAGVKHLMLLPLPGTPVPGDLAARVAARADGLRLDCRLWVGRPRIVF